jgi:tRNA A-37 threonylcarbamoyl transferase component Bud32
MIRVCPKCDRKYPEDIDFCAQDGTRLVEIRDDDSDPLIGRVLDRRWVIEERIGMGGMGAVYLGSQRSVDRKVAIKTLKPELCNSREFVERFFREARVASKISHPNSVTILDFGQTEDDTLFLAMEYLEGAPLTTRLREGNLSVREIIEICIQISSALAAAHDNNIIHRDLKPDNIYLLSISDDSTFIKVLDFGIAKVTDADEKMTQTGQVFGTPEYMSPEQCRGDTVDGRSDLYSLGCILYRMLVGRPPFESDTPMAVLVSHVSEPPQNVREVIERDDIPEPLAALCMQLLAKEAQDRPETAQAVRARLEEILGQNSTAPNSAVASATAMTLAAAQVDDSELAADGGAGADAAAARDSGSGPEASAAQKTRSPDGMTTAPSAADIRPKKSLLPIVLSVLVLLVLGSGCVLGGYLLWSQSAGEQSGEGLLADLLGDDESEQETANASDDSAQGNGPAQGSDPEGTDETGDSAGKGPAAEAIAANSDANSDPDQARHADAAEDSAPAKVAAAESNSASDSPGTDDNKETNSEDSDAPKNDSETVEIRAENVNVVSNQSESAAEEPETTRKPSPKQDKPAPPRLAGNIRQGRLTATGSACLKPNVEDVLRAARQKFLSCYSDLLNSNPDASGDVMLAWNITTGGDLLRPEVAVSDLAALNGCMLGKLKRLRFEPTIGGRCYVRVTYHFSP